MPLPIVALPLAVAPSAAPASAPAMPVSPDLVWLQRPGRHVFRWRDHHGAWHTAPRRVGNAAALARLLAVHPPRDVYVGLAAWLDPVDLPRLADATRPAPVLLDHVVAFDVDASPWSLRALEAARRESVRVLDWMGEATSLQVVHVAFSGAKGFHVVARDPDRAPFQVAEPRTREAEVRVAREHLLRRAQAAGLAVDPRVTADTRRVLRLPGTLHGTTGWACTVVDETTLRQPLRDWVDELPRAADAAPLPRGWRRPVLGAHPHPRPPRRRVRAFRTDARGTSLAVQATTQVAGTRDRHALLAWLPRAWGPPTVAMRRLRRRLLAHDLGPAAVWAQGDRVLVLVPRALPRAALARVASGWALGSVAAQLDTRGHAWVEVAPRRWRDGGMEPLLKAAGVLHGAQHKCRHPWSRPHLALAARLGQPIGSDADAPSGSVEVCGREEPTLRLVERR